ncbi:hypothetical protein ONE63_003527 [Megalurothrips usitatus]|uniref:Uncharacterized protein n=1 Tax=Megalurothrips usitatus TaxID=439358 RepID=A0AAV7X767_9NEOP|nr:hypothetical protein ONE63_003527 [Megalurothrips usitatus]
MAVGPWFLVGIILISRAKGHEEQLMITETKAIQVTTTSYKVATSSIYVHISTNLPSMTLKNVPTIAKDCDNVILDQEYQTLCKATIALDLTSYGILKELNRVFVNTDSVKSSSKQKRAILPIIGRIRHWLEGTVTDNDLDKVIESVNHLGQNIQIIGETTKTIMNATNTNAKALEGLTASLQSRMKYFTDAYNILASRVNNNSYATDVMFSKIIGSAILQSKAYCFSLKPWMVQALCGKSLGISSYHSDRWAGWVSSCGWEVNLAPSEPCTLQPVEAVKALFGPARPGVCVPSPLMYRLPLLAEVANLLVPHIRSPPAGHWQRTFSDAQRIVLDWVKTNVSGDETDMPTHLVAEMGTDAMLRWTRLTPLNTPTPPLRALGGEGALIPMQQSVIPSQWH